MEYVRLAVWVDGFIHLRVVLSGRRVLFRIEMPSLARSLVEEKMPPDGMLMGGRTEKPASGGPTTTERARSSWLVGTDADDDVKFRVRRGSSGRYLA